MKQIITSITVIFLLTSCQNFVSKHLVSDKQWKKEKEYVQSCREQWVYNDLKKETTVVVIYASLKSAHNLWHPNFVIGHNSQGDTIGLIDYDFMGDINLGDTLSFLPGKSRLDTAAGIMSGPWHWPLMSVTPKRKYNKILCSVKNVYYAEINKAH